MGRTPIRAKLVLDAETRAKLEAIAKARTEGQARVERAKVLLGYDAGECVTALAVASDQARPPGPPGGPWGLPPRASHRSSRARLTQLARQITGSLCVGVQSEWQWGEAEESAVRAASLLPRSAWPCGTGG